ncbi:MAG: hypothetical protein HXS50_00685 [Theionarchaea archaeon]|nr:hypothetical protein [Theionarchaea archaeon]
MQRTAMSLAMVLLIFLSPSMAFGKTDPRGIIRIICIGESYYPETPLPLLVQSDPKVDYSPLPANMGEGTFTWGGPSALKRFVRIYLPRGYDGFLERYDLIILSDYPEIFLEPSHYQWFERAIREEGAGLAKYELNYGSGGASYPMDPWRASAIYPAFPADLEDRHMPTIGPGGWGRPPDGVRVKEGNPLIDLPGVNRYDLFGSGMFGIEIPRQGAEVIGWFRHTEYSAIMTWSYGKGRSGSTVAGLDWMDYFAVRSYDFYPDFFLNQFYWLAGEEVPEDILLVNEIRRGLKDLQIRTQLVLSVVEFIETFGASGREIEGDLAQVDEMRMVVNGLYLDQEYEEASELVADIIALMGEIEVNSIEVKDRALLWVYAIEWLAVSGVALFCGSILYALMVRRRIYREVSTTRLSLEA